MQDLLKSNKITRRIKHSESGALLRGKLFDDKGNTMSPSFSSKNGIRYRFYVSTALRGRKHNAGSVTRICAPEIECLVEAALSEKIEAPKEETLDHIERITLSADRTRLVLKRAEGRQGSIEIPWVPRPKATAQVLDADFEKQIDQRLLKSIVRAHAWLDDLSRGRHASIAELAASANLHPKVIRHGLRLAFLVSDITKAAIDGNKLLKLNQIPKLLPLSWSEQHLLLGQ